MATPITWQSIARPDFDSVNKGLLQTAALFNSAVDGFKDPLKEANATVQQNWNQGKENNTNALLNKFAGFKTAEEAQAALESGSVAEMLGGYGAQVDGSAVRAAQQNLVSNLQKKAVEADTYQQTQLAAAERDGIGQAQTAIANGQYDDAKRIMQSLSPKTQAVLANDAVKHQQTTEAHKQNILASQAGIRQADERNAIDRDQLSATDRSNIVTQRLDAVGKQIEATNLVGKQQNEVSDTVLKNVKLLEEKQAEFNKTNPFYGKTLKDLNGDTSGLLSHAKQYNIDPSSVANAWEDIRTKYPSGTFKDAHTGLVIPITEGLFKQAITSAEPKWGFGVDRWKGSQIVDSFDQIIKSPDTAALYAESTTRNTKFTEEIAGLKERGKVEIDRIGTGVAPLVEQLSEITGMKVTSKEIPATKPVEVAPGVTSQKVGNNTVNTETTVMNPATGQTAPSKVNIPPVGKADFETHSVLVKPNTKWTAPKAAVFTFIPDGDTAQGTFKDGGDVACRITGIDAPETAKPAKNGKPASPGQPFGESSKITLQRLIENKEVQVEMSYGLTGKLEESYGRNICNITIKGDNVSHQMVKSGQAWVYNNFVKPEMQKQLQSAEASARNNKVGLWQQLNTPTPPVSPDVFRRSMR